MSKQNKVEQKSIPVMTRQPISAAKLASTAKEMVQILGNALHNDMV